MNAVVEPLPNCLATLRVEVGPEPIAQTREELVQQYTREARIPGFRPGKVPRAMVEKRFQKEISQELESRSVSKALDAAISEVKVKVLDVTAVDDIQLDEAKGLSFSATLVTVPEFELPEYKGIAVTVPSAEVTDEAVSESLDALRGRMADFVDVTEDRGAAMDDFIVVDYKGSVGGQAVHEAHPKVGKVLSENEGFWIRMSAESFFPGFCTHLEGARVGETRNFQVEVPADFPVEGFGGAKIDYTVTLKELKVRILPELTDEFASNFLPGQTLEDLKKVLRTELEVRKKAEIDGLKRDQVMDFLLSRVECELPEDMARSESSRVLSEVVRENQQRGVTQEMLKENEKELVASASQTARNRLKGSFILSRIAEAESLKVSREELMQRIAEIARGSQMTAEKALKEVMRRRLLPQIQSEILTAKALDFVVSAATVSAEGAA